MAKQDLDCPEVSGDRWSVARALALCAVEIAPDEAAASKQAEETDDITGREANFLACVTHRLTAKSRTDLPQCERYLERARKILEQETDPKDPDAPKMTGVRFKGEAIAIETARSLFDAHALDWKLKAQDRLVDIARSTNAKARALLEDKIICLDERVRRSTYASVRTNLIANLFILECAGALSTADLQPLPGLVAGQLDDWRKLSSTFEGADVSAIDLQTLNYASCLLRARHGPQSLSRLDTLATSSGTTDTFLMPYDRSRYRLMAELTQARLGN